MNRIKSGKIKKKKER